METRRHRRGRKKRLLLPLSLLCLVVLLPGALLAPSASASSSSSPAAGGGRKRRWAEFDYYVLALQWPGTICRQTSNCCETNGCCRSKPLKWFTIHGLWPQYNYGGWPSCCRPTRFNINKILMLMPILEKYWPSLYCGSSSTCFGGRGPFWVHEWGMQFSGIVGTQTAAFNYFLISLKTHGTCAYPEIQDEYDYFSTALYLYSKYNATKALRKAHIRPASGRKYAVGHIVAVIEYAFGAMPSLVCKNGSVQELRLCFHKDYQPRDCTFETDKAPNSRSQCPRYVTFPSYKPSVLANATEGISDQAIGELHAYG
ncbi:hypothetical protein GQ55_5G057300 [Panicum hallii var. hallii]|uniref:Uncharacterized protein n=1 Tax=Panicum hallii var. hallii TaxID=1504633 RepID=A0A2T7DD77_9POAL|nr:hypothetical protein GQ55_5G057300 [Panicum hallii var. hallii]